MKRLLILLLAIVCLSGCTVDIPPLREPGGETLPTVRPAPSAPVGDSQTARTVPCVLYMPTTDGQAISPVPQIVTIASGQSHEEALVQALLAALNGTSFAQGQVLRLAPVSNAVEVSGSLATVNLSSSARILGFESLFALRMALTNTLTELSNIRYVQVLFSGREPGLDVAMLLPTGVLSRLSGTDLSATFIQLEAQRTATDTVLVKAAALYFPAVDGGLLRAEVRNIRVTQRDVEEYAKMLLEALSKGATELSQVRTVVPPADYFERDPRLIPAQGMGETARFIELNFRAEIDDFLTLRGATRAELITSIIYTFGSFIPAFDGLVVTIGGDVVEALLLQDDTDWAEEASTITRDALSGLVADTVTVYFPRADGVHLVAVERTIAQRQRVQPRTLLRQLMRPPGDKNLAPAFPESINDADILGLSIVGDTALVNLSAAFAAACRNLTSIEERNLVYALVNTLTEIGGVNRVRLMVAGDEGSLAGHLFLGGEFLRNPSLIMP